MFNVTGGELFMILLVALIVLGPERLPSAARRVGKVMGQLRDLSEGFKREMSQALDDPGEPIVKPATRPQLTALDGGAQAGGAPPDVPPVLAQPLSADEAEAVATAEVVADSVGVGDAVSDMSSPTAAAPTASPTAAPAAHPTTAAPSGGAAGAPSTMIDNGDPPGTARPGTAPHDTARPDSAPLDMARPGTAPLDTAPPGGPAARDVPPTAAPRRAGDPSVSAVRQPEGESRPELEAMTLMEHLAKLRNRIIKCLLAVVVGATITWFFYEPTFRWLANELKDSCSVGQQCEIIVTDPLQGFSTRMTFSGYGGLALAMPVILFQLWRFIMPGLYPKERRLVWPFTITAVALFVLGAAVSLWTLPKALDFLIGVGGDEFAQFYTPDRYVSFTVKMMLAFGVGFEFPIFLVFLQLAGVVTPQQLSKWRRHAIVIIVVLVAVLTPSGDPISLAALALPMVFFYEGAILIGRLAARRKRKRQMAGV